MLPISHLCSPFLYPNFSLTFLFFLCFHCIYVYLTRKYWNKNNESSFWSFPFRSTSKERWGWVGMLEVPQAPSTRKVLQKQWQLLASDKWSGMDSSSYYHVQRSKAFAYGLQFVLYLNNGQKKKPDTKEMFPILWNLPLEIKTTCF